MKSIQLLSLVALAAATPLDRRDGWGDWSDGQYSVGTTPVGGQKTSSSSTTTTTTTASTWGIPVGGSPSSPAGPASTPAGGKPNGPSPSGPASTPAGGKPNTPTAPASTSATWGIPANGSPSSPVAPASTPAGGKPTGPAGGQPSGPAGPGCGAPSTVTVTVTATPTWSDWAAPTGGSGSGSSCSSAAATTCVVTDAKATSIVNNFIDLLQYTSYNGTQGAPGRGYHYNTSAVTLDPAFVDISDSINFMAGIPLGAVTFPNKTAFDYGQGVLQPEVVVTTLNIWHDCSSITWRWSVAPKIPNALPVHGINYMQINSKGLIQKNYAEFDNGAWIYDYGKTACYLQQGTPTALPSPALKL